MMLMQINSAQIYGKSFFRANAAPTPCVSVLELFAWSFRFFPIFPRVFRKYHVNSLRSSSP
jgi:hypothetical protein